MASILLALVALSPASLIVAGLAGGSSSVSSTTSVADPVTDLTLTPVVSGRELPIAVPLQYFSTPTIPHALTGGSSGGGLNINPTVGYTKEPAPMGISDLGISSGGTAYTYSTSEFKGTFAWNTIDISATDDEFTVQLNVVLKFVSGGTTYSYWIQDVALPTYKGSNEITMSYEDNVWNFSTSTFDLASSALKGNGTVADDDGDEWYYDVASTSLKGEDDSLTGPDQFQMLVTSYLSSGDQPEVSFQYKDPSMSTFMTYDNVIFFAKGMTAANDPGFTVDGTQYTPAGSPLMWSAEMDLGGPGGGSDVDVESTTDAHMTIYKWNGDNFESTPGAWNFGGDTGETSENVQSIPTWDSYGSLMTTQLNGTTRDDAPGVAYNPTAVGSVNASAPCTINNGYLAVGADNWHFNGTWANLTLYPGTYHMWMNNTGGATASLGSVTITAGGFKSLSAAASICPSVTTPTASVSAADVGQSFKWSTTASGGTGTYSTYTWTQSSTNLGCTLASAATISCVPTATGSYTVSVHVTDSSGDISTTVTSASFTVDPELSISTFTAKGPNAGLDYTAVSVTTTITASASGGASPYGYAYAGLPPGCTNSNSASWTCVPTTAGTYTVKLFVNDTNTNSVNMTAVLTVYAKLTLNSFWASNPYSDVGVVTDLDAYVTGGGWPLTYAYTGLPTGCTTSNVQPLPCTPTATGTFTVKAFVNDTFGEAVTATTSVTIYPALTISGYWAGHPYSDVDIADTLYTWVTGGAWPVTYAYTGLPAGCTSSSTSALACTPTASGTFTVKVFVNDSAGGAVTSTLTLTIYPALTIDGFWATNASLAAGSSTTLKTWVTGGAWPVTFDYTGLPAGCASSDTSSLVCVPTATGSYTVRVFVNDTFGVSVTSTLTLSVAALPHDHLPGESVGPTPATLLGRDAAPALTTRNRD